mmetsp:Transcript_15432/g.23129  ORF Transcript_15432/g.23129 Transcript_15432/m.23129 type:complete len:108 (+) Transcript_15432:34-357(+)|eukprot:CAMPEP_0201544810 /NCGR_PEP_ID=MMETSP0173_2-20130828/1433_1 /ASSEMBLY_ACC=CAM_ASM_000268 /TAXON_ID=218659 /ORGANISM="Vexillifera sp., Strain DIVA3 564/2" /LENGTH=107 /DNA_ID=CAMNT_0047953069 /DNA_START=28 /DNA_END=351 /DNA_ORIENTATION=+
MAGLAKQILEKLPAAGNWIRFRGHYELGLLTQDILHQHPTIQEAVSRLPTDLAVAREQRLKVGFDLAMKKQQLPADQWTKKENDVYYLQPYIDIVEQEEAERKEFRS